MELRTPPTAAASSSDTLTRVLAVLTFLLVVGLAADRWWFGSRGHSDRQERSREVASKLEAAGASVESQALLESLVLSGQGEASALANIAHRIGSNYLGQGDHEKALRWFYEAESLAPGEVAELDSRIVETLERMGSHYSAQAALASKSRLPGSSTEDSEEATSANPVVARVDGVEILRSDVDRTLASLPPDVARQLASPEQEAALLEKVVADELVWRKAQKLSYDRDPEVKRRHAAMLKDLAVSRYVERELAAGIQVDEGDLRNHFEARKQQYRQAVEKDEDLTFERLRPMVERDYKMAKLQSLYQEVISSELATASVETFPERLRSNE